MSLFIFRRYSTREPTSVVCNDEQVTYFILRAHTGTSVSHSQHRKTSGEVLEEKKKQVNGAEGLEISKEEIPGSKRSMRGYILTYSRL